MRIARGVCRTVFVGKKYVVKIPSLRDYGSIGRLAGFCNGYLANGWERLWSSKVIIDGVNPVLWHIGPINVYRTCDPIMVHNDFDYSSICSAIEYGDRKAENIGIHPELGLVWIDYG